MVLLRDLYNFVSNIYMLWIYGNQNTTCDLIHHMALHVTLYIRVDTNARHVTFYTLLRYIRPYAALYSKHSLKYHMVLNMTRYKLQR